MKRLWFLLFLPFALGASVWCAGALVDPHYRISASLKVQATPEAIYALLSAVEDYPRWRSDLANVEVSASKPALAWFEYDGNGRASAYVAEGSKPPVKWTSRITAGTLPTHASRTLLIVPTEDGGTEVAATEEGEIRNPLERFRYRFQTGYTAALDRYMADLRKRLAE